MKFFIYILLYDILNVRAYHLTLGDCPLYYDEPCNSDVVKFVLSTKSGNRTIYQMLDPSQLELPPDYNFKSPLKVTIHGYGGLRVDRAITSVSEAYRSLDYNVITVDWGILASIPCYFTAYLNTWHVGQCVAILAISLIQFGILPNSLHLIGFSLGAHIAGFAGNHIERVLGTRINRITGLDPALPLFAVPNTEWKLDPTDADFVDVVHTSAGSFGKIEQSGHVDFYVNGGFFQPYCRNFSYPQLCSHQMAGIYFAESINPVNADFLGILCENYFNYLLDWCSNRRGIKMGEYVNYSDRGIVFVDTADFPPFAKG